MSASSEPSPGRGSRSPISRQPRAPDPTTTSATSPSDTVPEISTDARTEIGPSGTTSRAPIAKPITRVMRKAATKTGTGDGPA